MDGFKEMNSCSVKPCGGDKWWVVVVVCGGGGDDVVVSWLFILCVCVFCWREK